MKRRDLFPPAEPDEAELRRRAEQKRKRQEREEAQRIGNQVADQVRARREAAARRRG